MENLTKENFFNKMQELYPDAMQLFCKWIDEYKKEVNWNKLFAANHDTMQLHASKFKFHEIPFEMQNGIIARFDIECFNGVLSGRGKAVYEAGRTGYLQGFQNLFSDLQNKLSVQKQ